MDWTRGCTIGRGSSATVSLAVARRSGDIFAVKSVELSKSGFLQREQRILSLLQCPRIVGYIGCDVTNENGQLIYNLFMEHISGGTLADAIQEQGGRLEESAIRAHTREILQGLDYLHSNGLVHCDIKGQNVLIGQDGAKIADLGCARWVEEKSGGVRDALARPIAGTPVFMAPEVARGDEQGCPADVWALGCTVIEMATGRPPWPEVTDPVSALYRIAFSSDMPDFPKFLSEEAKDFLSRCLRREPKERWTTDQLLKHPFMDEPSSHLKQIQDSVSNSPTSILDQGFWNSMEESEICRNLTQIGSLNSPAERIRQLTGGMSSSSLQRLPNWTWGENWVTVRSNNCEESEISQGQDHNMILDEEPTMTSGSVTVWIGDEEELELRGSSVVNEDSLIYSVNSVSSYYRSGFEMACKCIKVTVVVAIGEALSYPVNVLTFLLNLAISFMRDTEFLFSSLSILLEP